VDGLFRLSVLHQLITEFSGLGLESCNPELLVAPFVGLGAFIDIVLAPPEQLHRGDYFSAGRYLRPALAEARQAIADCVNILQENVAVVALRTGEQMVAQDLLSSGLAEAARIGDPERISSYLCLLGELAISRDSFQIQEAQHYLLTGLALARRIGNPEKLACHLLNLGILNTRLRCMGEALSVILKKHCP